MAEQYTTNNFDMGGGGGSGSMVVTLQEVQAAHPTLRLTLRNNAEGLVSRKPDSVMDTLRKAGSLILGIFKKAETDLVLDQSGNQKQTEKNLKKVDKMFEQLVSQVTSQRDFVKSELVNLGPEQQKDLVEYWRAVNDFLTQLFAWMKEMFQFVLEKIRQGYKVDREALKCIFDDVLEQIKKVF